MMQLIAGHASPLLVATRRQLTQQAYWTQTSLSRRPPSPCRTRVQRSTPARQSAESWRPVLTCPACVGRRATRRTAAFQSRGRDLPEPLVVRRRWWLDVAATWPCTATRLRTRLLGRARAASTSVCRVRAQSWCGVAAADAQRRRWRPAVSVWRSSALSMPTAKTTATTLPTTPSPFIGHRASGERSSAAAMPVHRRQSPPMTPLTGPLTSIVSPLLVWLRLWFPALSSLPPRFIGSLPIRTFLIVSPLNVVAWIPGKWRTRASVRMTRRWRLALSGTSTWTARVNMWKTQIPSTATVYPLNSGMNEWIYLSTE